MGLFGLGRRSNWASYADWQREIYARTIRAVITHQVTGQPIKTSASAGSLTLSMFVNPDHPDASVMPTLTLRPAAEGAMEILIDDEQVAHFKVPHSPERVMQQFRQTISDVFSTLMPLPMRPGANAVPGQVAV